MFPAGAACKGVAPQGFDAAKTPLPPDGVVGDRARTLVVRRALSADPGNTLRIGGTHPRVLPSPGLQLSRRFFRPVSVLSTRPLITRFRKNPGSGRL